MNMKGRSSDDTSTPQEAKFYGNTDFKWPLSLIMLGSTVLHTCPHLSPGPLQEKKSQKAPSAISKFWFKGRCSGLETLPLWWWKGQRAAGKSNTQVAGQRKLLIPISPNLEVEMGPHNTRSLSQGEKNRDCTALLPMLTWNRFHFFYPEA